MLDGTLCQGCGVYIGEGDGFPQYCSDCQPKKIRKKEKISNGPYSFDHLLPIKEEQTCVRVWADPIVPESIGYRCLEKAEFILHNYHNNKTEHLCRKHFLNSIKRLRAKMHYNPKRTGFIWYDIKAGTVYTENNNIAYDKE
jgi:hypothetical protein